MKKFLLLTLALMLFSVNVYAAQEFTLPKVPFLDDDGAQNAGAVCFQRLTGVSNDADEDSCDFASDSTCTTVYTVRTLGAGNAHTEYDGVALSTGLPNDKTAFCVELDARGETKPDSMFYHDGPMKISLYKYNSSTNAYTNEYTINDVQGSGSATLDFAVLSDDCTADPCTSTEFDSVIDALCGDDAATCSSVKYLWVDNSITMSANETVPADLTLKFMPGAVITYTGYTLTYSGLVDAGCDQAIFLTADGTGAVSGLKEACVDWFSTAGDGSTDDYAEIQEAIDSLSDNGKLVFTPDTNYAVTAPPVWIDRYGIIEMKGAIITSSSTDAAFRIGKTTGQTRDVHLNGGTFLRSGVSGSYLDGTGLDLLNVQECHIHPEHIKSFTSGILLRGTDGYESTMNTITITLVENCKYGLKLYVEDSGSTVNDNTFRNGQVRFSNGAPDSTGGYNVHIDFDSGAAAASDMPQANRFFGISFQEAKDAGSRPTAAVYNNGELGNFLFCRYEGDWDESGDYIQEGNDVDSGDAKGRNWYFGGKELDGYAEVLRDTDAGADAGAIDSYVRIVGNQKSYFRGLASTGSAMIRTAGIDSSDGTAGLLYEHYNDDGNKIFSVDNDGDITITATDDSTGTITTAATGEFVVTSGCKMGKMLNVGTATSGTISGADLPVTNTYMEIDNSGGADTLTTMSGTEEGDIIILKVSDDSKDITVQDIAQNASSEFHLPAQADFVIDRKTDVLMVIHAPDGKYHCVSSSSNDP